MNPKAIPVMLSMLPSVMKGVSLPDLEKIKSITRHAFPTVKQVDTSTLAEWMQSGNPPLLIDVRSPAEFAVSHLRGAINLQEARSIKNAVAERKPGTAILYCSVGFRSSQIAHRLQDDHSSQIFNLEGSIFQWANEDRPIFQNEKQVWTVHPYGKRWAGLLKPGVSAKT